MSARGSPRDDAATRRNSTRSLSHELLSHAFGAVFRAFSAVSSLARSRRFEPARARAKRARVEGLGCAASMVSDGSASHARRSRALSSLDRAVARSR